MQPLTQSPCRTRAAFHSFAPWPPPLARLRTALADRYAIERELGAGGMATVYLAQDLKHDRKVAVKVLRPELTAAHAAGVLHRDIKPGNVMLSGRHALVMDFGVAKAVSDAGGEKMTTVGVAVGTPTYMSPEQATGAENLDVRSDIYALGILAYEMLTGQPPFAGKNAQATLSAQVLEKPKEITEVRAAVSADLGEFVMRCLEKSPADRWQTTEELVPLLESLGTPSGGVTPTHTRPVKTVKGAAPAARRCNRLSYPRRRNRRSAAEWETEWE
jgi:serine/threonine protein kinase